MIDVSHISKHFDTFKAVDDVSFSIPAGQIVGLLGPNGAGKTTTMRMITGFLEPTFGEIIIDGKNIKENPVEAKQKIGYMPESAPMYGDMIVADYLEYIANVQGVNPTEKIPVLCEQCGLKEVMHKNINELSRGYRQRVGLAHSLMNDPKILILDEPTSGLDPNQIEDVRALIKEIGKTRTVIVSTHILGEVEMICDRVIIISGGKLVADGSTAEIKSRFGSSVSIYLEVKGKDGSDVELSAVKSEIAKIPGIDNVTESKGESGEIGLLITQNASTPSTGSGTSSTGSTELRPAIFDCIVKNGWTIFELSVRRNSLEEVFHALTTKN